jgi:hypothetical protein
MAIYPNRICWQCGRSFAGGPRARYCPDCWAEKTEKFLAFKRKASGVYKSSSGSWRVILFANGGQIYVVACRHKAVAEYVYGIASRGGKDPERRKAAIAAAKLSAKRFTDIAGRRFGRLTALSPVSPPRSHSKETTWRWRCQCDCGEEIVASLNALTSGRTISCGCAQREAAKALYRDGTAPMKLREGEKPRVTNTSGVTGVWYNKRRQRWTAELMFRGKKYYLGRYVDISDAIAARKAGEESIFGSYLQSIADDST